MDLAVWLRSIGLEQYEAAFRENGSDNYVALAATADGTTAGAYFSQGSSQTLTVNMAKFAGAVTAKWFDPTNSVYTTILDLPFSNTGTHNFSPSSKNNVSDPDWVLLLSA